MSTLITVRVSPRPHHNAGKSIHYNEGIIMRIGYHNEGESIDV
jgi:hypothetical protein